MDPAETTYREIPFNSTSADDRAAVLHLLGEEVWTKLEALRARRVTGRSARLLMRVFGELLVHRRNAYLQEELVGAAPRRRRFFGRLEIDLTAVEASAGGDALVMEVLAATRGAVEELRREVAETPARRARLAASLGAVVGKENVRTDPFTLVAHATDATDWRLFLPVAVVMPDEERQVAPLLEAIAGLLPVDSGAIRSR